MTAGPMRGAPPFPSNELVTLDAWQDPPGNRWAFQHVRELIPTARIRRAPEQCGSSPATSSRSATCASRRGGAR